MSEVQDLVLPVLRRIQSDLADLKQDVATVRSVQGEHTERLEELEIYLAYATGLTSQNKADVRSPKTEMRIIKKRLDALELQP